MHIVNMEDNFKLLPDDILFKIQTYVYHIMHSDIHNVLLQEFQSYVLEKGEENWDMGSTILARMEGMPLLERVE